jgi:hypothetical protein
MSEEDGMNARLSAADIEAIGSLCPRLYEAVGWDAGKAPDWAAFRACCHPDILIVPMGSGAAAPIGLEAFIAGMEGQRTSGTVSELSEVETSRHVEGYANLASVRSTFVATINGIERRGVTFAHLVREGGRWMIVATAWENEREGEPLPAELD